ncbi:hypothetical protein [Haloglomus litoreum]|uniref:hypothetical protein n=1 Tax=Haloglomus litoreum TaxID=3034026 RepID=UPI0023E7ED4C|nr:hypothetical protein [Haloglomus sp. DT116]
MPSRRSVLAASGTAAATALAGCSALTGPEGSAANVREDMDLRPEAASLVGRTTAESTRCPRGDVEVRNLAYEFDTGDLQLVTVVEVRPGARGCDDSDWVHEGIDLRQAWPGLGLETKSGVAGVETNVRYADTDDPEVRLRTTGDSETGEWRVRRASDDGDVPERYAFRSTYVGAEVEAGDELAAVTTEVPFSTGGLLGGESETVTRTGTLVYGEREE